MMEISLGELVAERETGAADWLNLRSSPSVKEMRNSLNHGTKARLL